MLSYIINFFAGLVVALPSAASPNALALKSLTISSIEPEAPIASGYESSLTVRGNWNMRDSAIAEVFGYVTVIDADGPVLSRLRTPVSVQDGFAKFKARLTSTNFNFAKGGFHVFAVLTSKDGRRLAFARQEITRESAAARAKVTSEKKKIPDSSISFDSNSPTGGKQSMTMEGYINGTGEYDPGKDSDGNTCEIISIILRAKNKDTNALYTSRPQYSDGRWSGQIVGLPAGTYEVSADLNVVSMRGASGCVSSTTDTKEVVIDP